MELLLALEKKIISLVELTRKLQAENHNLSEECRSLRSQVESLERSLLTHGQKTEEVEHARLLVDELIRNIDLVVERELVKGQEKLETLP